MKVFCPIFTKVFQKGRGNRCIRQLPLKRALHLFPHLEAFFQLSEVNVHKTFTVSSFRGIPPLTTEAFNPPDSFAKSPSTCFLTQKHFCGVCDKTFTKYLQFPVFVRFLHLLPKCSTLRTVLQKVLLPVSSLKGRFLPLDAKIHKIFTSLTSLSRGMSRFFYL